MKKILILLLLFCIPIQIFSQSKKPYFSTASNAICNIQLTTPSPSLKLPSSFYNGKKSLKIAGNLNKEIEKPINKKDTITKTATTVSPLNFNFYNFPILFLDTTNIEKVPFYSVFSNNKPMGNPIPTINYKRMKNTGYGLAGTGIACHVSAGIIVLNYLNDEQIYNSIKITKTNLHIVNSITHSMKKSTVITMATILSVSGIVFEIWGGIKIGKAIVGLDGIKIPIK